MNASWAVVLVRADSREANRGDLALLAAAARLARKTLAVCLGPEDTAKHLDGLCHECLVSPSLAARPDAATLAGVVRSRVDGNTLILLRHDSLGMDLGAGMAVLLDFPCVTNVRDITGTPDGGYRVTRPEFNGEVMAEYAVKGGAGALFTVMPGAFSHNEPARVAQTLVSSVAVSGPGQPGRVFLEEITPPGTGVNLRSAPVLVAVGRGMGSAENMAVAFRLAAILGGEVCCSRAVADAGWLEKDRQVGLSGESVSPALYLALGLNGAFQHMVGVQGSPCVIAVNTNKDAPIFHSTEIGVVADAPSLALLLADALESGV